jgi:16S rRNA (guanine966-N2)-methyltransferase
VAKANKTQANKHGSRQLRIIGGSWRGRKIQFAELDGLRPTSDRIRETLFNWLQAVVGDARCLDLFAGSGALGFEALSRGAAAVDMVEKDPKATQQLRQNQQQLNTDKAHIHCLSAEQFLQQQTQPYHIVFIDPPFQLGLWQSSFDLLLQRSLIAEGGYVYAEFPSKQSLPELPASLSLSRDKTAGDVRYCLYQFDSGAASV